jgi:hypothetical protein
MNGRPGIAARPELLEDKTGNMASPSTEYVKGIHRRFGYFGTWLPNAPIALGDIGFASGCSFKRVSSLTELGITFPVRASSSPMRFHYAWQVRLTAGDGASAAASLQGTGASAHVLVGFQRAGAFVFQAEGCVSREFEDKVAVARSIATVVKRGRWDARWSVIDNVVHAASATILMANSGGSSIELAADAHLPDPLGQLAQAGLNLHVHAQHGDVTHFLARRGLTPMFKVARPRLAKLREMSSSNGNAVTFDGFGHRRLDDTSQPAPDELWEALIPTETPKPETIR